MIIDHGSWIIEYSTPPQQHDKIHLFDVTALPLLFCYLNIPFCSALGSLHNTSDYLGIRNLDDMDIRYCYIAIFFNYVHKSGQSSVFLSARPLWGVVRMTITDSTRGPKTSLNVFPVIPTSFTHPGNTQKQVFGPLVLFVMVILTTPHSGRADKKNVAIIISIPVRSATGNAMPQWRCSHLRLESLSLCYCAFGF